MHGQCGAVVLLLASCARVLSAAPPRLQAGGSAAPAGGQRLLLWTGGSRCLPQEHAPPACCSQNALCTPRLLACLPDCAPCACARLQSEPERLRQELEDFLSQRGVAYKYSTTTKFANFRNRTLE